MSDAPLILPICSIQPDFDVSVQDVRDGIVAEDVFWLSCYKEGEDSVHGKVHLALDERDRNRLDFDGSEGVEFKEGDDERSYFAACNARGIPFTKVTIPEKTFSEPLPQIAKGVHQKITAFDVAPDGSQFAAGYHDGSVYLLSTSSPKNHSVGRRCHLSTVTSVRFFPSSRVLLTAGNDFAVNVVPAELPEPSADPKRLTPVRSLRAHTRAVTSTAIIARGRTVLSASKDATLRLWDIASGSQIRMMPSKNGVSIMDMSAGERGETTIAAPPNGELTDAPHAIDPREVDTQDKVVYTALSNGTFEVFDLNTKLSVFHSRTSSASSSLESISYSATHNLLATGSFGGIVSVYDTRSLTSPLTRFKRNGASIESLTFTSASNGSVGLAVATQDGLPYVANVRPEGPSVRAELIGPDCDGVRVAYAGPGEGQVWTAGDDGIVRLYTGLSTP